MLVFSRDAFIADQGDRLYQLNKSWIDECNGEEVRGKFTTETFYYMRPQWCVEINSEEELKALKKKSKKS